MKRTVIKIDEDLCNGCGLCVNGCHEGALQLINGKAVMISDLYCDGLGACIGECPVGAISFEEREAEPYNEELVMERLVPKGEAVILAHLNHLKDFGEEELVHQGLEYLKRHNIEVNVDGKKSNRENMNSNKIEEIAEQENKPMACGCPGSMAREVKPRQLMPEIAASQASELSHFPVQLHLVNPNAHFFKNANLLLAADCTAFACGNFHSRFLKGKALAIACPKLDSNTQTYIDKLVEMIDTAEIDTLTVVVMEVPCCSGLVRIAQMAREQAQRNIPVKIIVVSVGGEVLSEKWI